MTVLITGGGGYIGSHAVKQFLMDGEEVVVIDNFSHGYREPLERLSRYGNVNVVEGDIRVDGDLDEIFSRYTIDTVLHFAALCSVDESMKNPGDYFETNVMGTVKICEAMNRHHITKLVFSSTCAVYGDTQYVPVDEAHELTPVNPYGESKAMAEKIIGWYGARFGLRSVILRYFNVCGADHEGIIGDSKSPSVLLVQNAVRGALGLQPFALTYPPVDTKDGSTIRDYINVEDLIDAHVSACDYLASEDHTSLICNVGTEFGSSVLEVIDAVEKELGVTVKRTQGETREGESPEIYADASQAKELLHWQPKRSLADSIRSLAKWYTMYPDGYRY